MAAAAAPQQNGPWEDFEAPGAEPGPWQDFQAPPKTTGAQAVSDHFRNAATFGYLPQLEGLSQLIAGDPSAQVDAQLRAKGVKIQQAPQSTYLSRRDAITQQMQQEEKDHPYLSAAASLGGGILGAAATTIAAPIEAASSFGRVIQAAKGGALIGAVSNPGDTAGQVSGFQLGDRAKNAALGAGLGAGTQTAIEGVTAGAKALTNLPNSLQNKAEERAFKAAGAMLKDYRDADKAGRIHELGRFMLDHDLVQPGMSVGDIAQSAQTLKETTGKAIGDAYDSAFQALKGQDVPLADLNPKQLAQDFLQEYSGAQTGVAGGGARTRSVQSVVDDLAHLPKDTGLAGVNEFRQGLDDFLYANNKSPATLPETKQGLQAFRSWLDQRVDGAVSAVDRATGGNVSQQLPELNRQYGLASEITRIAKDQSLRQNANHFFSPTDYLSGATGAVVGAMTGGDNLEDKLKHAAIGAGIGLANKGMRTYGTPLVSMGLDRAGAMLANTPLTTLGQAAAPLLNAAERSPLALSVTEGMMSRPSLRPARAVQNVVQGQGEPNRVPANGPDAWAQQGIQKLGIQDPSLIHRLLQDPQSKHLLIQASDLQPGSRAMKTIMNQIQKGAGRNP